MSLILYQFISGGISATRIRLADTGAEAPTWHVGRKREEVRLFNPRETLGQ